MKLAYVYGTEETVGPLLGFKGDAYETFTWLKQNGYAAVEPFVCNPKLFDNAAFEKTINRVGIEVASVGTGPVAGNDQLTFTDKKREVRHAAIERAKDIVDFASRFGAPVNIGKLRGNINELQPEQSWSWMREGFLKVCEHANNYGVNIVLEPQNEKNINNLNTTAEALAYIERLDIPNFFLMLDTYHLSFEEDSTITASLIKAKNMLLHLHFADSNRGTPGQGKFDFAEIMKALHQINYQNYLSMEVSYQSDRYLEAKAIVDYLATVDSNQ